MEHKGTRRGSVGSVDWKIAPMLVKRDTGGWIFLASQSTVAAVTLPLRLPLLCLLSLHKIIENTSCSVTQNTGCSVTRRMGKERGKAQDPAEKTGRVGRGGSSAAWRMDAGLTWATELGAGAWSKYRHLLGGWEGNGFTEAGRELGGPWQDRHGTLEAEDAGLGFVLMDDQPGQHSRRRKCAGTHCKVV